MECASSKSTDLAATRGLHKFSPHGVHCEYIDDVLGFSGFRRTGPWVPQPHDGRDPSYTKCHGYDRAGGRMTAAWVPDDDVLEGLLGIGWAADGAESLTGQEL